MPNEHVTNDCKENDEAKLMRIGGFYEFNLTGCQTLQATKYHAWLISLSVLESFLILDLFTIN